MFSAVFASLGQELARGSPGQGPLYVRLATCLRQAIQQGRLSVGVPLPPERDLAQLVSVSRQTVRKAVEELTQEGLLKVRQGSGTFVAGRLVEPLTELASFSDDMRRRGLTPSSIWLKREIEQANTQEAFALSLSLTERVCRVNRVRLANDEPIAIELAVVAAVLVDFRTDFGDSLYGAIRDRGRAPVRALQRVRAGIANESVAQTLEVPLGSPVLEMERFSYSADGKPVEWTRSTYRGDMYDYVVEMRIP
ncbi:MAG: GntR family transcriptional regulator [Paucibacter sp.]|nr:GntR family transcriptional regulator [Roseateles sp.]